MDHFPETDPDEQSAASSLVRHIDEVAELDQRIYDWGDPEVGSPFDEDYQRAPEVAVHLTTQLALRGAAGCLLAMEACLEVDRREDGVGVSSRPFGGHAILRNAMEYAAAAVWILAPDSSPRRINNVLTHELEDAYFARKFVKEAGLESESYESKLQRLIGYAEKAGVDWRPKIHDQPPRHKGKLDRYPPATKLLEEIQHLAPAEGTGGLTWLAHWQLASGLAHGKTWAFKATTDSSPRIELSETYGHTYVVTMPYRSLLATFGGAHSLLRVGIERYERLATC